MCVIVQSDEDIVAGNEHVNVAEVESIYNWMGQCVTVCQNPTAGVLCGWFATLYITVFYCFCDNLFLARCRRLR